MQFYLTAEQQVRKIWPVMRIRKSLQWSALDLLSMSDMPWYEVSLRKTTQYKILSLLLNNEGLHETFSTDQILQPAP